MAFNYAPAKLLQNNIHVGLTIYFPNFGVLL
jgi:hypothetical protein